MLEENGRLLRVTREAMGLSYAEVEEATKVREFYLQKLEEGNLAELPGRIYAIGFMESYAKFLGLDAEPFVAEVKEYYAGNSTDTGFETYISGKKVIQTVTEGGTPEQWHEAKNKAATRLSDRNAKAENANRLRASAYSNVAMGRPLRTRNHRFGKRFLWILLGSLVVVLLLMLYLLQDNPQLPGFMGGDNPPPVADNVVEELAPVTVIVTAGDEEIWLGYKADGGENNQVTLAPGLSQGLVADEHLYLRFNKATKTRVEYNGEVLEDFSGGYDVWNINFYPDDYAGYADQPTE